MNQLFNGFPRLEYLNCNKILILARCGNYYPCSINPCENDGQCIAMYPSPNLEAYEEPVVPRYKLDSKDWNNTEAGNIFLMSPTFSKWEDAANYCVANNASLLELNMNNSILR